MSGGAVLTAPQPPRKSVLGAVPSALLAPVVTIGQTFTLMFAVIKTAVQNPVGYWRDTFEEMYSMYRFCWLPTFVCAGTFGFLIGNFAYNFLRLAGGGNRLGTFFTYAMAREIAPFTTGMAVAGVMGTAMCADLGARKVREELDALRVLGVDIVRTLVLPRVISIIMMCTAFNLLTIGIGTLMALISASVVGDTSPGAFFGLLLANFTAPEMAGSVIKMAVIGLFIGVVCAQKGLNAGGGAEGVGRAVNQAVVLCFAATWIFDFLGNMVLLGMFPEVLINR